MALYYTSNFKTELRERPYLNVQVQVLAPGGTRLAELRLDTLSGGSHFMCLASIRPREYSDKRVNQE